MATLRRKHPRPRPVPNGDQDVGEPGAGAVPRLLADLSPAQRVWLVQVIVGAGSLAESSPVELAVPAIRVLLKRQGVQTGAPLGSLLAFLLGYVYGTALRCRLVAEDAADSEPDDEPEHWSDRWITRAVFAAAAVLPAAGALLPGTVVFRERSPLWGLWLWLPVRLVAALVLAVDASHLKKQREKTTAAA